MILEQKARDINYDDDMLLTSLSLSMALWHTAHDGLCEKFQILWF
jgi:hypothetical protein